jgi:hypothetical protein
MGARLSSSINISKAFVGAMLAVSWYFGRVIGVTWEGSKGCVVVVGGRDVVVGEMKGEEREVRYTLAHSHVAV